MASPTDVVSSLCKKTRKCSKEAGHKGRCNTQKQINSFWELSPFYQLNAKKRKFLEDEQQSREELNARENALQERSDLLSNSEENARCQLEEKGMYIEQYKNY